MSITRRSSTAEVRKALVLKTGSPKWEESRWWNEFRALRRKLLSKENISPRPSETEKAALEEIFKAWVDGSDEWWAQGSWTAEPGLIDWHITQYLRGRKSVATTCVQNGESPPADKSQSPESPRPTYYDPIRE
ncbi:hypothetical protein BP6252_14021 [Coleophoma cylindrospora]|uniref:Uncharacterized protein n=1 Tax=Coleophoma cylindrospora TaxID=1849047 RepID=A0A3D8Q4V3_9HELO|nr:hypothetical protein BP6252_14021 [Coleophoma cylindrospora]